MLDLLMDFIFDLSEGQQALIMFGSMILMIVLAVPIPIAVHPDTSFVSLRSLIHPHHVRMRLWFPLACRAIFMTPAVMHGRGPDVIVSVLEVGSGKRRLLVHHGSQPINPCRSQMNLWPLAHAVDQYDRMES